MVETEVRFPPKFEVLFAPQRYKCFYGGRGGAKSWAFARALLIEAARTRLRVLCTREVQRSIKDSVHKLLSDQIEALDLLGQYQVLSTEIRGRNGSEFIFAGLADQTAASIKSYEGIDRVWIEEAQAVSQRSLDILIPTIRKEGSEIWISFNPELDSDPVYKRFVLNPPPNAVVRKVNYSDNPWFPAELEAERLFCKEYDPGQYEWIWEGNCRPAVEGAIYAEEVAMLEQQGHFVNLPPDPRLKTHVIVDLGFNDAMSIIMAQRQMSELRVVDYIEDSHRTLDSYSAELKERRYNWGKLWLPHDGFNETLAANGASIADLFRKLGWAVARVPNVPVEEGIKAARIAMRRTYLDRHKAGRLIECLKRYRRNVPTTTGEATGPVHDEYSHGADAFRYMSLCADKFDNDDALRSGPLRYAPTGIV